MLSGINGVPPNLSDDVTQPPSQATGKSTKVEAEWTTYEATAYTAFCSEGCIGVTATGLDVSRTVKHRGRRIVAVDPRVVPLGSRLTILTADGRTFEAIAEDTGGAIKGRKIDVLVSSERKARKFGRQRVSVKVLE
ncbi:3D (Asp-Asp-Asp) domain-containing protein [Paenibacillus jamilae]|uniref:3D domain-containing protein n=1 Tax=Paenibacillus polymyxa TaxID=1406 RepID=UPI001C2E377D|nr:3D domain-containing protein [Paenibacillus polymyxa]MDP9674853.1 3D (Asp-Asp-Asp) domain-containing protein [Paenibacillus jamilae]